MPNTFHYRFVTDDCIDIGRVDAADVQDAAAEVLLADAGSGIPRWKVYGISDKVLNRIPRDAELVDVASGSHKYSLDLRKAGTRKRKPVRVLDAWS
ncbi:MAG: hypothetical protein Q8M09_14845 [Pseudomonadota bacterium]|nr:hypothetical protein [Pseudomonadota bacterium]MDP1905501.1 hypothetical protein [Pseudomonadota bacterium]